MRLAQQVGASGGGDQVQGIERRQAVDVQLSQTFKHRMGLGRRLEQRQLPLFDRR